MDLFQKLTPHISEVKGIYKEAFDFVFNNPEIKNVAVSGAFGAGKSSVFESYMQEYKKDEKLIHISLADFEQLRKSDRADQSEDQARLEARLEAKIINQLIHQIDPKYIKKSSFTAQIKNDPWKQVIKLLGVFIAILFLLFIILGDRLEPFLLTLSPSVIKYIFIFFRTGSGILILFVAFLMIIFFIINSFLQHSRGNNLLKSFSVKDISLELSDKKVESFFDQYLSEIRYLFENSGSTIVAIEDIDRYLSSSIFEKIRELNTIINYDEERNSIRFFYIIKDDIFKSTDRTKFFDFIIPIVPVMDSSNSYSQLKSRLVDKAINLDFDNSFLRGLSFYIDDMRILKNVINEFLIYQNLLAEEDLDPNKLLAFITYKNLFPKDFNDLQVGKGYLHSLIKSRSKLAEDFVKPKKKRLSDIETEIEEIRNESLNNIDELNALYLKPIPNLEKVAGKRISRFDTQLDLYRELKTNPTNVITVSGEVQNVDISSEIAKLEKNPEYSRRKDLIKRKEESAFQKLENEKREIEESIEAVLNSHSISNLINQTDIESFLSNSTGNNEEKKYNEIKDDLHYPIIRFLIIYKMIDGNYEDYLTFFYKSDLQISDQRFIRSVNGEKPLPRDHKLTNPKVVLEILQGVSEYNSAFINKDLFFHIFNNRNTKEAGKLIRLLQRNKSGHIIRGYLNDGSELDFLISELNTHWKSFYNDIVIDASWDQKVNVRYLKLLLIHSNPNFIGNIEEINSISDEINKNIKTIANIEDNAINSVINNLQEIGAKFTNLDDLNSFIANDQLVKGIYDNDLYKVSLGNIQYWIETIYDPSVNLDVGSLISIIISKPEEPLSLYVQNNLNDVCIKILNFDPTIQINDNQKAIWLVLDSPNVDNDIKESYIQRLSSPVKDIRGKTDKDLLNLLLLNNKVTLNLNNLLALFTAFNNEFTPEFISYLMKHRNNKINDKPRDSELYPNEINTSFFDAVLNNPSLYKILTAMLLRATQIKLQPPRTLLNQEKAEALISSKSLIMNSENLAFIRSNYPSLVLFFEIENISEFKSLLDSGEIVDFEEIVGLLESKLDGTNQKSLLSHYGEMVPYKETYRHKGTKKYIIEHRLNLSDLEEVISDPIAQSQSFFPLIKKLIVENIERVISDRIALPYKFFTEVINEQTLNSLQKLHLFSNSMANYKPEQIKKMIYDLNIVPFTEMLNGTHPNSPSDPILKSIFQSLSDKGMASLGKNGKLYRKLMYGQK